MVWFDSKYEVDNETASLPSTLSFFPNLEDFEDELNNEGFDEPLLSDWALKKLGTLQSKLEKLQHSRDVKHFASKNNLTNFSRNILYKLANEVFGYNGWSTSITNCVINELPMEEEGRYSTFCMVDIRLILKDGTRKDATGIGESTNMPHKYMCYQIAKKKAVTDAMKSAIIGLRDLYFEYEHQQLTKDLGLKYDI
ncbi:RAD59 DNA repair protein RAD59 [Candida maltosa Xu316]